MQAKNRIEYIDVFRSFGIILMVMGHIGFTTLFDHFIHAFHMPMFFFVSGFFFKSKSKKELSFMDFLKKKGRTLLLPYLFFGVLHYIIYIALYGFSAEPLLHLIWVNTDKLPIAGALWFLTALFFADLFYFVIDRYLRHKYIKALVVVILSVGGCLANLLPFALPFGIGASLAVLLIYYLGHLAALFSHKKFIRFATHMPWYAFLLIAVVTLGLIFVNGYINMRIGSYGFIPLFYVNVLLSVVVLINLAQYMFGWFGNKFPNNYLMNIGKNSIVYLSLNQIFILLLKSVVTFLDMPVGGIGVIGTKMVMLTGTMVLLWLSEYLLTNTRLKFLIGK